MYEVKYVSERNQWAVIETRWLVLKIIHYFPTQEEAQEYVRRMQIADWEDAHHGKA